MQQAVGKGGARRAGRVAVCLAALAWVACAPPAVTLEPKAYAYTPEDYESVYRAWTRDETPFDFERMESIMRVTATFEAEAFRWAYVTRYAHDFGLSVDERGALLDASLEDAKQYHRFFVTLAAGSHVDEVELTRRRSAWRVVLMDDRGRQTRPVEIEYVRQPTPAHERYFPTVSNQRRAFRVAFPAYDEDGNRTIPDDSLFAVLRFMGPKGTVSLSWDFQGDAQQRRRMERKQR